MRLVCVYYILLSILIHKPLEVKLINLLSMIVNQNMSSTAVFFNIYVEANILLYNLGLGEGKSDLATSMSAEGGAKTGPPYLYSVPPPRYHDITIP